jgi:uncharacterized membrane protein
MNPDRLRLMVSWVLMIGLGISAVLIAVGFAGSVFVGWRGSLLGAATAPLDTAIADFGGLTAGLAALRPQAIAQFGLLVLVATPILRVAASLVGFALEGDRQYVAITAIVLAILLASALFLR